MTISFVIATVNRPSLLTTLKSIETMPGDEILVVGAVKEHMINDETNRILIRYVPHPPGGDWGHTERNYALPLCRGDYVAHIDDDDVYRPGARRVMDYAINQTPGAPIMFRMQFPNGITIWRDPQIRGGNIGTPMFLMPNQQETFGKWGSFVGGDCHFLETSTWTHEAWVWRPEVIAQLGHNVG